MNRFVRNEFMHNKFIIIEENLRFILMRQNDVLDMMEQAFDQFGYFGSICATIFGWFVPVISVQTVPIFRTMA
ncbi:MAG: hypothetical protein JEZ09_15590 [Salinivirgaceae bacterium]|nr:hypothetical protein [Salinivirgaceae bacterium]